MDEFGRYQSFGEVQVVVMGELATPVSTRTSKPRQANPTMIICITPPHPPLHFSRKQDARNAAGPWYVMWPLVQ